MLERITRYGLNRSYDDTNSAEVNKPAIVNRYNDKMFLCYDDSARLAFIIMIPISSDCYRFNKGNNTFTIIWPSPTSQIRTEHHYKIL